MKRSCSIEPNSKAASRISTLSQADMGRGKRVKFADMNFENPLSFRLDDSSRSVGVMKPPRSDNAKTSEYAFFKKLKEDAGQTFTSLSAHNEPKQSDNFCLRNTFRENFNRVNNSCKDIRSSFLIENATPVNFVSFPTPRGSGGTPENSDVRIKKACATLEDVQLQQKDIWRNVVTPSGLRSPGTRQGHAEVFNRKRQKLRRWVTDISYPEIDGLCPKGCDIVSVLLSRLIPESKDNNNVKNQKLEQEKTDAKTMSLASSESDIYGKKLQWKPNDFTELECGPYLGDAISYHQSNKSTGRILYLDEQCGHHGNEAHHQDRVWGSALQSGTWALWADSNSSSVFPLRRFQSVELLEDLDEFHQPNRYLVGNQTNTPMLDWDFNNNKLERNLSIGTNPTSLASWVDDDKFYASRLLSLSNVHSNKESESSLMPLSCISSYHIQEHGIQVLESKEDMLPASNHIPLTLSYGTKSTNYFSPDEDCFNDNGSPHQDHWFISKLFSQGYHRPQKALLSSGLVLDLGWKSFPISDFPKEKYSSFHYQALEYPGNQSVSSHYNEKGYESCLDDSTHKGTLAHFSEESEDNVGIHDWSSFCFQVSLDREERAFPLMLDI